MRFSVNSLLFALVLGLSLTACSPFEKVKKSTDVSYKLTKANEYYDKKWYIRASDLYRDLIPVIKGTKNYEAMYYRYAYSYFYMGDYLAAGYHFKNFTEFFPNSKEAEECEYMYTVCLFKESPKSTLEQTNTIKAMEALQQFINSHPNSKYMAQANAMIDEGRKKLEDKDAKAAKLYYNIAQYKAAAIAYKSILREYPESPNSDYYQYMVVRSSYRYARASINTKQAERYEAVQDAFRELQEGYPNSTFIKDGQKYVSLSAQNLKTIKANEQ